MKKRNLILLGIFLFALLFLFAITTKILNFPKAMTAMVTKIPNNHQKTINIDKKVLTKLEKNNSVRVMIKYKEPTSKRLFSTQKEILPKEKIHHKFNNMFSATISQDDLKTLKNNPDIESIKVEPIKHIFLQDSVNLINATNVWPIKIHDFNLTGKGQTVCIIDTGIDYNHSDFGNCYGNNNASSDCKILGGWDFVNNNNDPKDDHGHGTHVAGIVAANGNLKGIAPEAKIIMIKALDENGSGYDSDILAGMDWCINNATKFNISVISLSLGGDTIYSNYCDSSDTDFRDAINSAVANNISVVIATGNSANITGISSPACIQNATRVGDTYKKDYSLISWGDPLVCSDSNPLEDKIVCHANRGSNFPDMLLAPGAIINSTWNDENYAEEGGTSMATPMVAGAIAIINQYKKLESNQILTPDQTKNYLISSGKKIKDTAGTNLNFSRINIYSTILSIDKEAPNITSMFPENNSLKNSQNQSFTCNATDLQFANLTIKIYNLTSLVKNISTTQESLTTYFNTTNGEYNWSCTAIDDNSNIQTKTFFLTACSMQTKIISPTNNTYTNQNETTFNCSTETINELKNITFSIYNSTNLLFNQTKNITGTSNYSLFNYNLTNEGEYYYNCISFSNESDFSQTKNYTITYDKTNPTITLTSPANNTITTSPTTFQYDYSDASPKNFCNLTINNQNYSDFTQTLLNGNNYWNISCTDKANNTNISETRKLEIYTEASPTPLSEESSPLNSSTPIIIEITKEEIKQGVTKKLKENEKLKFEINSENHELKLNSISSKKINITIQSDPINLTLYINQTKKIDFNDDKIYDLKIKLLGIESSKANIFIMKINETIPMKHIFTNETIQNQSIENKTKIEDKTKEEIPFFKKILNFINKILKYIRFLNSSSFKILRAYSSTRPLESRY